jgi:putative Ca2+/H+ antiporter (TMEM165/GDT1 family)
LLVSTFALVFLAGLGDKTQLATLGLAASSKSRLMVFAGASASIATIGMAVLVGEALTRAIPPAWIHRAAGLAFVVMGILFLLGKDSPVGRRWRAARAPLRSTRKSTSFTKGSNP